MSKEKEKKEERNIGETDTPLDQVNKIMERLGLKNVEGDVKGGHMAVFLNYLAIKRRESVKSTLSKLSFQMQMDKRRLRENYFEGVLEWGIIEIMVEKGTQYWVWTGEIIG